MNISKTFARQKNGINNQIKSFTSIRHTQTRLAAKIPMEKYLFKTRNLSQKVFVKKDTV